MSLLRYVWFVGLIALLSLLQQQPCNGGWIKERELSASLRQARVWTNQRLTNEIKALKRRYNPLNRLTTQMEDTFEA